MANEDKAPTHHESVATVVAGRDPEGLVKLVAIDARGRLEIAPAPPLLDVSVIPVLFMLGVIASKLADVVRELKKLNERE